MRRIMGAVTLMDTEGAVWMIKLLGPSNYQNESGWDHPQITIETPDDPDHWAYGEDGPTFDLYWNMPG